MAKTTDHCVKQSKQETKRQALDWKEVELFRACVSLTVDLSLISGTYSGCLTTACNSSCRGTNALF